MIYLLGLYKKISWTLFIMRHINNVLTYIKLPKRRIYTHIPYTE